MLNWVSHMFVLHTRVAEKVKCKQAAYVHVSCVPKLNQKTYIHRPDLLLRNQRRVEALCAIHVCSDVQDVLGTDFPGCILRNTHTLRALRRTSLSVLLETHQKTPASRKHHICIILQTPRDIYRHPPHTVKWCFKDVFCFSTVWAQHVC